MKKRLPVAEKRARRVMHIAAPRQQATGTHCELAGVWQGPAGASISLYEGQLFPSHSGRPCLWTYVGLPTRKTGAQWAIPEHNRL